MLKLYTNIKDWFSERPIRFWLISYASIALFTFGFASVEHKNYNAQIEAFLDAQCSTLEDRVATGSKCYMHKDYNPDAMAGLFGGIFWPLYWTQKTFQFLMPGPTLPTVVTKTVVKTEYVYPEETDEEDID